MNDSSSTAAEPDGTEARRVPAAPSYASLPAAKPRSARGSPAIKEISVRVKVVTPILGGGTQTRSIDEVDIIRPATVRGHLRFWWRALYGSQYSDSKVLIEKEGALWGRAAGDEGGRSAVDIRIVVGANPGKKDESPIQLGAPSSYGLWPAREEKKSNTPTAPRREPGTHFQLMLRCPADHEKEVRDTVRAWLLFGGYGGRTRRGLGSLTVMEDAGHWLPSAATLEALTRLFGRNVLIHPQCSITDTPWLDGASLQVGPPQSDAQPAWHTALGWLREFRQGYDGDVGRRAREPGAGGRPSISNWPEADKIRRLTNKIEGHRPRHNGTPAWPRAGFGLPIIGQFQNKARDGTTIVEPRGFELRWRSGPGERDQHDRLGSPLILKALPLADGRFVPCALWLNRAHPRGEVFAKDLPRSEAPFDRLVAEGDKALFDALAGKSSLRDAFLDWLSRKFRTTKVAP